MKVLVAGDYAYGNRLKEILAKKEFGVLFDDVKDIVKSADVSIVNYENPVLLANKKYIPIPKRGPSLQSPVVAVDAIAYAGFNVATLANNHIMDYGSDGCMDAISTLNNVGVSTVGAGADFSSAEKILYVKSNDETLAIINCCEHEFSIASDNAAGANPLNPIRQYYSILEARKNADYVVVIVHGGHEYFQFPSLRMQETYRFFIDAGADAVINHHQHCFSGYEFYKTKPIVYGLGNFCFNSSLRNSIWNEGYLALLNFCDGIVSMEVEPYVQCNDKPGVFIVEDRSSFDRRLREINSIISDQSKLKKELMSYYKSCNNSLVLAYEPYSNRYLMKLRSLKLIPSFITNSKWLTLLNLTECEAHRDKVLHMMHREVLKNTLENE